MAATQPSTPLSRVLPPLILGGAGFSYQLTSDPNPSRTRDVLKRAFELGLRAIDTSAYYEPSEELIGEALSHPEITTCYTRDDYFLMTKVGRVSATKSDYSPEWIRYSVSRSLQRLRTSHLDVVFCHDIEFVPEEDALQAIGVLLEMAAAGKIRYIGISGYPIGVLARVACRAREIYGRPLDVIQNWAQMTLQNDRLEQEGLQAFKDAGVSCVCSSSPLGTGLLRDQGVPVGRLGDWHPAPEGLRKAAQSAATYVASHGESLASLALRYALRRAQYSSTPDFRVGTIVGATTVTEVEQNVSAALRVLRQEGRKWEWNLNGDLETRAAGEKAMDSDTRLFAGVQQLLGEWRNYSFSEERDKDAQTKL
ncbi:Aldo/keto reductase family-domain-containing protein [Aspergillus lucknowensis]|uniref:Aldo/keto reductase family-domain-containing protein n=1 Tax=Aspergillus lucknowensis TaxID=176173 RepID=A0ABR4LPY9_9EURO